MDRPSWAPPEVDLDRPSPARMYDYMLGGLHNFAPDRRLAEQMIAAVPGIRENAHANRGFLRRAVEYLTGAGVRQFLDLGSGIPTVGNVHEAAHRVTPEAKVVYVDVDPVAVAHSRAIVANDDRVSVIQADVRDIGSVLAAPELRATLDLGQPVGVLLVALLHFIPDTNDANAIVRALRDAVVPGSFLVISQVGAPTQPLTAEQRALAERYTKTNPVAMRSRDEVAAYFEGLELVEPGLVEPARWRADGEVIGGPMTQYAGVARKPQRP